MSTEVMTSLYGGILFIVLQKLSAECKHMLNQLTLQFIPLGFILFLQILVKGRTNGTVDKIDRKTTSSTQERIGGQERNLLERFVDVFDQHQRLGQAISVFEDRLSQLNLDPENTGTSPLGLTSRSSLGL